MKSNHKKIVITKPADYRIKIKLPYSLMIKMNLCTYYIYIFIIRKICANTIRKKCGNN